MTSQVTKLTQTHPKPSNENADFQKLQFPWKLHRLLEEVEHKGLSDIISWMPDGRSFRVFSKQRFADEVMPLYFDSNKFKSFQRSLNLWGFQTVQKGADKGQCLHRFFMRGHPNLCAHMQRIKIKGTARAKMQMLPQKQPHKVLPPADKPFPIFGASNNNSIRIPTFAPLTNPHLAAIAHSNKYMQHVPAAASLALLRRAPIEPAKLHAGSTTPLLQALFLQRQREMIDQFITEVSNMVPRR